MDNKTNCSDSVMARVVNAKVKALSIVTEAKKSSLSVEASTKKVLEVDGWHTIGETGGWQSPSLPCYDRISGHSTGQHSQKY